VILLKHKGKEDNIMARPLRIEFKDAFYHIIQRGIERKNIFISNTDKNKFLSYIDFAHIGYGAIFHSYALMNNHYHLILQTPRANLSKVMHYLNTSYATYFNTKRKRVGPLYQGRFKAVLVQQDEYLHHLSRYIHLNPIRVNIVKDPIEYPWSSYKYFVSSAVPPQWMDTAFILSMFDENSLKGKKLYKEFVLDEIGKGKSVIDENTIKGFILGTADFAENIINRFILDEQAPEVPVINELKRRKEPSLEKIKKLVEENIDGNKKLQRRLSLYLSRKHTQKTLNNIAAFYGRIKDTGVSQAFSRTENARGEDKGLDKLLVKLEMRLNV
jgi:REP element-mobilizing transposase RayT